MPPAIAVATIVVAADQCHCVGIVVVVVVVIILVDVVVVMIVVVVIVIVVFVVFIILVVLFVVVIVVIIVFVVFVVIIVVVVFLVIYKNATATAIVSLLPILVDCCLCPRPSLLSPLSSPPTAVVVTVAAAITIASPVTRRDYARGVCVCVCVLGFRFQG